MSEQISIDKHHEGAPAPADRASPFDRLLATHQAMLFWFARSLGAGHSAAEDLVQETFVAAWRAGFEQRSDAESAGYLRTSLARLVMRQRKARGLTYVDPVEADRLWQQWQGDGDRTSSPALEALQECLRGIDERQRRALELQYREGASVADVANALELKPEGAHSLLRRTREQLRECIKGRLSHDT